MNPYLVAAQIGWGERRRIVALLVFVVVGGWLLFLLVIAAATGNPTRSEAASPSFTCVGEGTTGVGLTPAQEPNAALIVTIGQRLGVSAKGLVIALATALQESNLENISHGDRDSLGLFQQRPGTGWGTPAQIMDPELSTLAFYGRATHTNNPGLLDIAGWESMSVTVAAQAVQRSGFPEAYAKHEARSVALVEALTGSTGLCEVVGASGVGVGPWRLPLAAGSYTPASPFGMRQHPITGVYRLHSGADLAATTGTPVSAVHQGKVTFAGQRGTYGNLVIVDHGGGITTRYAHMNSIAVALGASVPVGGVLGEVGSTGGSTGPHLHIEVRSGENALDPVPWLRQHGVDLISGKTSEGNEA